MVQTAGLNPEYDHYLNAFMNLELHLNDGFEDQKQAVHRCKTPVEEQLAYRTKIQETNKKMTDTLKAFADDLYRYVPRLKFVMEKVCHDALSADEFPFIGKSKSAGISVGKKAGKKPRLIGFVKNKK